MGLKLTSLRFLIITLFTAALGCQSGESSSDANHIPDFLLGDFSDDYDNSYTISDSLFVMGSETIIHIQSWDLNNQFFIGQNDSTNVYDPGKYSRIDWIELEDMKPYSWAFCMSAYNALSPESIMIIESIDPKTPKTGCNGFPYSRMRSVNK